jgi:ubiquitin C-terminal hydrolase
MQGINNLGSTCAINSLIQMITRCDKLRNIILNSKVADGTFTGELKEIIDLMYNQNKSLNPAKFLNHFYSTFQGIFNRFEQIDINELWFYLYEKINNETSYSLNPLNPMTNNLYEEHNLTIQRYNSNKSSEILENTQGSFINIIECSNCNNKSYSFEPFINIAIDITDNNKTIADLLIASLTDEMRVKDEWKCDKCKGNHNYLKMKRLWKLPSVLFITINRFNDIYNKNNNSVYINDNLNFNKGSVLSIEDNIGYNLESIGLHYGSLMGGHYMAACNINNDYYIYNDSNIQVIEKQNFQLNNSNAYLLIYSKIN